MSATNLKNVVLVVVKILDKRPGFEKLKHLFLFVDCFILRECRRQQLVEYLEFDSVESRPLNVDPALQNIPDLFTLPSRGYFWLLSDRNVLKERLSCTILLFICLVIRDFSTFILSLSVFFLVVRWQLIKMAAKSQRFKVFFFFFYWADVWNILRYPLTLCLVHHCTLRTKIIVFHLASSNSRRRLGCLRRTLYLQVLGYWGSVVKTCLPVSAYSSGWGWKKNGKELKRI